MASTQSKSQSSDRSCSREISCDTLHTSKVLTVKSDISDKSRSLYPDPVSLANLQAPVKPGHVNQKVNILTTILVVTLPLQKLC